MSVVLTPGIDLGSRTLILSIPSGTTVSEDKIVARCGSNNLIGERVSGGVTQGYIQYVDSNDNVFTQVFYASNGTNLDSIDIPAGFGTVTEINEDAVLYPYIKRTEHEKKYLITEDMGKSEFDSGWTKIWTNPSPNSNYVSSVENRIPIDLSKYNLFLIQAKETTYSGNSIGAITAIYHKFYADKTECFWLMDFDTSDYGWNYREIDITSTYIDIGVGYHATPSGVSSTDNSKVIPLCIYGMKL